MHGSAAQPTGIFAVLREVEFRVGSGLEIDEVVRDFAVWTPLDRNGLAHKCLRYPSESLGFTS